MSSGQARENPLAHLKGRPKFGAGPRPKTSGRGAAAAAAPGVPPAMGSAANSSSSPAPFRMTAGAPKFGAGGGAAGSPKSPGGMGRGRGRGIAKVAARSLISPLANQAVAAKEVLDPAWFYGKISRPDAEQLTRGLDKQVFLVRESSKPGQYALTLWHVPGKTFLHLLITPITASQYQIQGSTDKNIYDGVSALVEKSPVLEGFVPLGNAT